MGWPIDDAAPYLNLSLHMPRGSKTFWGRRPRSVLPLSADERREREKNAQRIRKALWVATTPKGLTRYQQVTPDQRMKMRDRARQYAADKYGHMPPPLEQDCPPRPADGCCQCCGEYVGIDKLVLDHDHQFIGEFLGWCCTACNNVGDDLARLEARVAYLIARGFRAYL